jgi:hypothetical protein
MNKAFLILFILFASCTPQISKDFQVTKKVNMCEIVDASFTIDYYGNFSTELLEFLSSTNSIDVLQIKIRGGHPESSFLKRWTFVDNTKLLKNEKTFDQKFNQEIKSDFNALKKEIEQIEQGSYIQICNYTTANISYLYLIKIKGVIKFQYSSSMKSNALDLKSKNKIQKFLTVFRKLELI